MLLQARKLDLIAGTQAASQSQSVSSLLFEPWSRSLALMLSNSSFLLYPSFAPFAAAAASALTPTLVPPAASAACFVRLQSSLDSGSDSDSNAERVLFITASPGSSAVLLRGWILPSPAANLFVPARLSSKQHLHKPVLALGLRHGLSVSLAGSVNVFVLHSLAANQIWVFAVRIAGEDGGLPAPRLSKCAVVDCTLPIYSIGLSMGFLLLGELGGVRIFPLKPLIKGSSRQKKSDAHHSDSSSSSCKLITAKLAQNSGHHYSFFVEMFEHLESQIGGLTSPKAVSFHALSRKKFLILDSGGDVHLLDLHNTSEAPGQSLYSRDACIHHFSCSMKVQMLAVMPDTSTAGPQVIWISDGGYSVHMIPISDMESTVNEKDNDGSRAKTIHNSAIQAIFTSDKVQDLIPQSANTIMVLGVGNIFAYAIA